MKLRKHMLLIVGGSVALVVLLATLFVLVRLQQGYQRVNKELRGSLTRLDALYARDPYPSVENVYLVWTNLQILQTYFTGLYGELQKGQVEPQAMEPAEFPVLLEKTIRQLTTRAAASNVALPPRFAFGFSRYAIGALPGAKDVPRLVLQMKTIEALCGVLFRAKVSQITTVSRQVFEEGASAEPSEGVPDMMRRRRRPMEVVSDSGTSAQPSAEAWKDPSGLFSREHYVLSFTGRDAAIWEVLNGLAVGQPFVVVTKVELVNDSPLPKAAAPAAAPAAPAAPPSMFVTPPSLSGPSPAMPLGAAAPAGVPPKPLSHDERIVAGRELVRATVEVDVYRFATEEEPKEEEEEAP